MTTEFGINPFEFLDIHTDNEFNELALKVFRFQQENCSVYQKYVELLGLDCSRIQHYSQIPFLPIELFKSNRIIANHYETKIIFKSSGTTGQIRSEHHIADTKIYEKSTFASFESFYGPVADWCILALLPSYMEQGDSSLVYMIDKFVSASKNIKSGFYLNNSEQLHKDLVQLDNSEQPCLLIGVSYALLDFFEQHPMKLENVIVMETGGMKGRRKELLKSELHNRLTNLSGQNLIHSEYGMTELLSQAYSIGNNRFRAPNWMKILIREVSDPLQISEYDKSGGINIIDLANLYSCSFIATQDLGRHNSDGSFEIIGRFDHADSRGCNQLLE